jgi:hypothetical protein
MRSALFTITLILFFVFCLPHHALSQQKVDPKKKGAVEGDAELGNDLKNRKVIGRAFSGEVHSLAIQTTMNYQGLLEEGGVPATGTKSVIFRLYDTESGGTECWSELQSVTIEEGGLFNVMLGEITPITGCDFTEQLFLEIEVEGEVLVTRQALSSVPYAMLSNNVTDGCITSAKIATDAVGSGEIAADAVGSSEIATNAVGSDEIASSAVGRNEIATNAVGSGEIADDAVTMAKIDRASATSGQVIKWNGTDWAPAADESGGGGPPTGPAGGDLTGTYPNPGIAANAVGSGEIASGAVGSDEIATDAVGSAEITADAIGSSEIAANAVSSGEIANDAVTMAKIDRASATSGQVIKWNGTDWAPAADESGGGGPPTGPAGGDLTGTYPNPGIAANAVGSGEIATDAVGSAEIATNAVGNSEIASGAVGGTEIAEDAVNSTHLYDDIYIKWLTSDNVFVQANSSMNSAITAWQSGSSYCIWGEHYNNGFGIIGSTNGSDVFGIRARNRNSSGTGLSASGNDQSSRYLSEGSGLAANGSLRGIYGRAEASSGGRSGGYFSSNNGGWAHVAYVNASGDNYKIYGTGAVSSVMPTTTGDVVLIAPESPEAWVQDFGSGRMQNGRASVELDPTLVECATISDNYPMKVFITFTSPPPASYYVNKGMDGFEIISTSSDNFDATFDYFVSVRWKGWEDTRFEPADPPPEEILAAPDPENMQPERIRSGSSSEG